MGIHGSSLAAGLHFHDHGYNGFQVESSVRSGVTSLLLMPGPRY